jgi:DNA anti-recombination protein RmuC
MWGVAIMQIRSFVLAYGMLIILGVSAPEAQENKAEPSARQQLQTIHTPQSIEQELDRLTKDLQLTPEQQQQVRPLLQLHHDRIQALLDKNPNASRQDLGPQIHAISDETHREIHALLTDHQRELEKTMQDREHKGRENRNSRQAPAPPSDPSLSAS